MGDVFDAMTRAERERSGDPGNGPSPQNPQTPHDPDADTKPALPISEVQAATTSRDSGDRDHPASQTPEPGMVTAAARRAEQDATPDHDDAVPSDNLPVTDSSLNGYSTEVIVHHDRGSIITEQYRAIRTQILARARNRRLQTHVITSSAPSEGKSVTSVNLGVAFAELRNQKTLLVEGDLRRPSFAHLFDRAASPGLLHILRGEVDNFHKAIHPTVYENLQFLPAGDRDFTGSTELLSNPLMTRLLENLKDEYDHIFIDTPPVITVTDACILGAQADETLLVVRLGRTHVEVVDRAKRLLRAANCELAGVVLTHMKYHVPRYLYRYV